MHVSENMSSPYDVLGIDKSASNEEVKRAYRALQLKFHPDRNPSPDAATKSQEINDAYAILSDPQKRRQFDMQEQQQHHHFARFPFAHGFPPGQAAAAGGFPTPFGVEVEIDGASSPLDIFQMLFGGGIPGGGGGVMFHDIGGGGGMGPEIMFQHGGPPPASFFMHQANKQQQHRPPPPIQETLTVTLEQAYTGCTLPLEIERWVLHQGHIKVKELETVYVDIPAGIDESEILTLVDKGNVLHDECKGAVKLTIHVDNTTAFRRQGMDLVFVKTLSLKEALCGFSFELKHLNGKTLAMNNKQTVVKPHFRKTVPGFGMMRDAKVGSLIIEFDVQFPDVLTTEQIETLQTIL